ncbi:hypothetical protein A2960_04295 [Candidatus Gottesmanbacteria bacterium RIFCSPLOWO2_01_FULL_39_12b]|uniref:Type 4 fimbrial biogenesis protein PilX N-terminal domain-containing protein n=1 Tax=Candidatus Gottesmanbacteria bacterium RIFCSPLOWO2_01_FULL_39_12b TaxID=1798388 RepID=A0A1F6AS47_9BACT|nr:MAG: hypothetical protein A2960_04295 [Candidatus Gottesmanbacteria bacterium RIFCSPLOWO2_01_FULL_39_12b]
MKKKKTYPEKGQALIILLIFMIIALTVTSAGVMVVLVNSISASSISQSQEVYFIAESGIENALLRLARDPNYTGENVIVGSGTTAVTISGGSTKTITSTATLGNFKKQIIASALYNNYVWSVNSWKENF